MIIIICYYSWARTVSELANKKLSIFSLFHDIAKPTFVPTILIIGKLSLKL